MKTKVDIKSSGLKILAAVFFLGFSVTQAQTVLYQDSFAFTGILDESVPEVNNTGIDVAWTAPNNWGTLNGNLSFQGDGSQLLTCNGQDGKDYTAFLPFQVDGSSIYTLSVELRGTVGYKYNGIGFVGVDVTGFDPGADGQKDMSANGFNAMQLWVDGIGNVKYGTANGWNAGTDFRYLSIVLDSSSGDISFYIESTLLGTQSLTAEQLGSITGIGLGTQTMYGTAAYLKNLELLQIPEPSDCALLVWGGMIFAGVRYCCKKRNVS
jgi:hypothetical protein